MQTSPSPLPSLSAIMGSAAPSPGEIFNLKNLDVL